MTISLTTADDLQEHFLGVLGRSAHHAGEVNEVLLTLAGAMLWRKRPGDPIRVNTKEGAGGNVIWFHIDEALYALRYNHDDRVIELRAGGRKGELLRTFTNATPTKEVVEVFAGLGGSVPTLEESVKVRKPGKEGLNKEERHALRAERLQRKVEKMNAKASKGPVPEIDASLRQPATAG